MIRVHFTGSRSDKLEYFVRMFTDSVMMQGKTQKRYKLEDVPSIIADDHQPDFLIVVEEVEK